MGHSGEVILDGRHLEVAARLDDGATDVDLEVATAGWLLLLSDLEVNCLGGLGQARRVLIAW